MMAKWGPRGTPPVGNHLVFGQFAVEPPKPQVQPSSSQAQPGLVKPEAPSPQVSPAPQTLTQQSFGLQNLPASFLSNSNSFFTRALANYRQEYPKHLTDTNNG
ncbi:hypothetical protein COOONC_02943 [Cooperia oncophora]